MSDLYRIELPEPGPPWTELMVVSPQQFDDGTYQPVGRLVPDGRLQAIADAWNKANNRWPGVFYQDLALAAPKLVALLDALGGTDNDD